MQLIPIYHPLVSFVTRAVTWGRGENEALATIIYHVARGDCDSQLVHIEMPLHTGCLDYIVHCCLKLEYLCTAVRRMESWLVPGLDSGAGPVVISQKC